MPVSQSAEFGAFLDSGGIGIKADSGATVDNIFIIQDTLGQKWKRVIDYQYRASWAGLFGAGDKTSTLQAIASNSSITEIVIDTQFTVNGTVTIPSDTILKFEGSGKISGTGTLTGGIISARFRKQIFDININVNCWAEQGIYSVMWFGAKPDGTNAQPAIQRCFNLAIASKKISEIRIPAGSYVINKGVLLREDRNADNVADFINIAVRGEGKAYSASSSNGAETILTLTDPNDFAFGIQKAKGVTIENINLMGQNTLSIPSTSISTATQSTYINVACRSNTISPHAGFIIDPFGRNTTAPGDMYPNWDPLYYNEATPGSTDVTIRNCTSRQFVVGVANSINGGTQNAECMLFENIWVSSCAAGFASGQAQAKTVILRNWKCWGLTYVVFDCLNWGSTGTAASITVDGANIAGGNKFLMAGANFGTGFTHTFNNVFTELLYAIGGDLSSGLRGSIHISNSQINLVGESASSMNRCIAIASCDTLSVDNSYIGFYTAADASPMIVHCSKIDLVNYSGNPLIPCSKTGAIELGYSKFNDLGKATVFSSTNANNSIVTGIPLFPGKTFIQKIGNASLTSGTLNGGSMIERKYTGLSIYYVSLNASTTVTIVNNTTRKATVSIVDADEYKLAVGAFVFYTATKTSDYAGHSAPTILGIIESVDTVANTMVLKLASRYATVGDTGFQIIWLPSQGSQYFGIGDITSGSANITNILGGYGNTQGILQVNHLFFHPFFPEGTYVVSDSSGTAVLSAPATATETNAFLSNYHQWDCTLSVGGKDAAIGNPAVRHKFPYAVGTIIKNTYSLTNTTAPDQTIGMYVVVKSGMYNASGRDPIVIPIQGNGQYVDSFSLVANGNRAVALGETLYEIHLKPTVNMTLSIGTVVSGTDIQDNMALLANTTSIVDYKKTADSAFTLYFTGVSGGTLNIKLVKKIV